MAALAVLPAVATLVAPLAGMGSTGPFANNSLTSMSLMYQNNLNVTDDVNHISALLLDRMTYSDAVDACAYLNETLIPISALRTHESDLSYSLRYQEHRAGLSGQLFWAEDGVVRIDEQNPGHLIFSTSPPRDTELPLVCTQSSNGNSPYVSSANPTNAIQIESSDNTYVGYRNLKSFLFLGIPYANPYYRFQYSDVYNQTGQTIYATGYSAHCAQPYDGSSAEACWGLNIQTPYIPKAGSKDGLRPVVVSIHGGGFVTGAGSQIDSGNLVSREDVVGISINYRLGTFGFMAIPGTDIKGNYGVGDQVTALRWIKQNIANFGGDPNRITIIGGSAGASSVRALLGSPPVVRENLISGAIAQSNLGGGIGLGQYETYFTQFSSYPTVNQSYEVAGQQVLRGAGCTQDTLKAQVECLKTASVSAILNAGVYARFVVQDGTFIDNAQTIVDRNDGRTANVDVMFGDTVNDGGSFTIYPAQPVKTLKEGIQIGLQIGPEAADSIINSGLFPLYDTGNLTLDAYNVSQRVQTDFGFLCVNEAFVYAGALSGAFKSAYYYTANRTYGGYDPNNLGNALTRGPTEPGYPNGNPNVEYFKLHSADAGFEYGLQYVLRDLNDLKASRLISNYFGQFIKTGNPNPSPDYLQSRGYLTTIEGVSESGAWQPIRNAAGPTKVLDYPSSDASFPETQQCAWLKYPISYYLDGGS